MKELKESLYELNDINKTLKENSGSIIKDLSKEAIYDDISKLINEDNAESKQDKGKGVKDTQTDDDEDPNFDVDSDDDDDTETSDKESDGNESDDVKGKEWKDFDKYKIGNGEYDFSNVEDKDMGKIYSILQDSDQIVVKQEDDNVYKVTNTDDDTEYVIIPTEKGNHADSDDDLDDDDDDKLRNLPAPDDAEEEVTFTIEPDDDDDDDTEILLDDDGDENSTNKRNKMKESKLYELNLQENLGYTDDYQKKDVMTLPSDEKQGNDWDAGVPHGNARPYSKLQRRATPYDKCGCGKNGNCKCGLENEEAIYEIDDSEDETPSMVDGSGLEEGLTRGARNRVRRSRVKNSETEETMQYPPHTAHEISKNGRYVGNTNESTIMSKAHSIFNENRKLKQALNIFEQKLKVANHSFNSKLNEASVLNANLGNAIKLISENSTTQNEKLDILNQMTKAKTLQESKMMYNTLKRTLNRKPVNIHESIDKPIAERSVDTKATTIYESKDMNACLDLMDRMEKL